MLLICYVSFSINCKAQYKELNIRTHNVAERNIDTVYPRSTYKYIILQVTGPYYWI
jgi:hypothetical protein